MIFHTPHACIGIMFHSALTAVVYTYRAATHLHTDDKLNMQMQQTS